MKESVRLIGNVGGEVVALGMGTKCLSGEFISDAGLAVNDCHAGVIQSYQGCRLLRSEISIRPI